MPSNNYRCRTIVPHWLKLLNSSACLELPYWRIFVHHHLPGRRLSGCYMPLGSLKFLFPSAADTTQETSSSDVVRLRPRNASGSPLMLAVISMGEDNDCESFSGQILSSMWTGSPCSSISRSRPRSATGGSLSGDDVPLPSSTI